MILEMKANALPEAIATKGSMWNSVISVGITRTPAPTPDHKMSSANKNPARLTYRLTSSIIIFSIQWKNYYHSMELKV